MLERKLFRASTARLKGKGQLTRRVLPRALTLRDFSAHCSSPAPLTNRSIDLCFHELASGRYALAEKIRMLCREGKEDCSNIEEHDLD